MGRILEYVVLLSNLSVILGVTQYLKPSQSGGYGRGNLENFTHLRYIPKERNELLGKKLLPVGHQRRRPQMVSSPGLQAYASDYRRRNSSEQSFRHPRENLPLPPFSQGLYPRRHPKNYFYPSQKLSKLNNHTFDYHKRAENRKFTSGRNSRYHHAPKICDPCNSVPWVPLLQVPESYRQHRTHITELHPTPQQNHFDFHPYPSSTHNVLLPPLPLPPPIFDQTISSSFGLPVGNIPTGHGLLAPPINTIDYSSPFNYYSPHGLLENNNFPELSPVPVVPIHDSGQFFQFDTSVPDLVPPPSQPIDVSKVVLTISEDQKPFPPNHKHSHSDLTSQSTAVDFQSSKDNAHSKDFGRLEIVKSVPLAEFKSTTHQQRLPLYPPLQSEFPEESTTKDSYLPPDHFVPPPNKHQNFTHHKNGDATQESSAPQPLTSPSLSWLFSDHTSPPADSKATASVSSFTTDVHEIASVVNNELRPVSPHPLPLISTTEPPKNKKIQIIIPYTTKNTNSGHDSNALESVHHEVVVGKPTNSPTAPTSPPPPPVQPFQNRSNSEKYVSEMHHIIASNIRELLREEIEKSQKDQNYPLQNNIDNWTALEYSNHKTVQTKAPKEIIAQALAVTSIPGTSISHFLLPSKKIPSEYLNTTPLPLFDEPNPSTYKTDNPTVHSRPFTAKPYATTNVYNPSKLSPTTGNGNEFNHEKNYTEVETGRVNAWGRLNENLVLPEARTAAVPRTGSSLSFSTGSEKIQIVTPIPQRNRTTTPFRRTTRHVPTTDTQKNPTRKPLFKRLNSTKLEKVSNLTSSFSSSSSSTVRTANVSTTEATTTSTTETTTAVVTETTLSSTGRPQQFSINDIIPFRNKELPWEPKQNSSEGIRMGRQRKSLIKQANLHKSKTAVGSS